MQLSGEICRHAATLARKQSTDARRCAACCDRSFAARTGDLLFISGIPGFDAEGALPEKFEAQFANVVTNIKRILDEAGATMRDLVKVNVLLTRASDVATMNALYATAFGPAPYPARTTCVVQALPDPKMLIEIECVAQLSGR